MAVEVYSSLAAAQFVVPAVVVFLLVLFTNRRYNTSISDIPGPFFASIGDFWHLYHVYKGHTEEATIELHQKYGHFVRLSHEEVSVSHPDGPRAILAAPLHKSKFYRLFALPHVGYNNLMSERDPKRHQKMFRNLAPGFAMSHIIKSEPFLDSTIGLLEERLDQASKDGAPVNLDKWLAFTAFDILGEVTFSNPFGFLREGKDIRNTVANTYYLALYIVTMTYLQRLHAVLLGNPIFRWLNITPSDHAFETCIKTVEQRKKNGDVRLDMIGQWMLVRKNSPEQMSDREILNAAAMNLGAGGETIAATVQAFIYYLLKNPKYLARLRDEIDAADARGELSSPITYAEAQNLPFLQACIKETLRYHSGVAWGLPREVPNEGLTIGNRHFKKGTILSVNPWVIHRSTACFGPTASLYDPTRWLDPTRAAAFEKFLIPFGLGYNSCPGRNLASLELTKLATTLLRNWDIELVNKDQEWEFQSLFIAVPRGWPVRMARRRKEKAA